VILMIRIGCSMMFVTANLIVCNSDNPGSVFFVLLMMSGLIFTDFDDAGFDLFFRCW